MLGFGQILKFIGFIPSQRVDWDEFVYTRPSEELCRDRASSYHGETNLTVSPTERCFICGCSLSIEEQGEGEICLDPAHWQASGALSATDYTSMAQIEARARAKKRKRG